MRCPYGIPRGRVAKTDDGCYCVLQGNDAPFLPDVALAKVIKEMNLGALVVNNLLKVEFEQHETMIESQRATIERILATAQARAQ